MARTADADGDFDPQQLRIKMEAAPKAAQIAPRGDVLLLFGAESLAGGAAVRGPCLRVFSQHLTLKSAVFRRMLDGHGFAEERFLRTHGCLEKVHPDDHYEAFRLIMQVLHGHHNAVPGLIALPLLAEVATLVDKYEWHEVMRERVSIWIAAARDPVPRTPEPSAVLWLWIFWVFDRTDDFKKLTRMLEWDSTRSSFDNAPKCPLPECVIAQIKHRRENALMTLKASFDEWSNRYLFQSNHVSRPAAAFAYGMCQMQGQLVGLTNSPELARKSFRGVASAIYNTEDTGRYRIFRDERAMRRSPALKPPAIKQHLVAITKDCEAKLRGIPLESMKKVLNRPG